MKYPNTYMKEDAERDMTNVLKELPKVGSSLSHRDNSILKRWAAYFVDYSKATKWYFAYLMNKKYIVIEDAENYRNIY